MDRDKVSQVLAALNRIRNRLARSEEGEASEAV